MTSNLLKNRLSGHRSDVNKLDQLIQSGHTYTDVEVQAHKEKTALVSHCIDTGHRIDFRPDKGVYDLHISNTSYGRDNGRFECRIKASGTGADVHQEYYNLTVLTPPQPPLVAPGTIAVATEDKKLDLTCSSIGGSPDPTITWYRVGSNNPLQAPINRGGSKDLQTTSTLSVLPRREDDGAKYRCVVWNRAMPEGHRLETVVTLSVNSYTMFGGHQFN
ncbi:echinoid [Culex quinquefasciatus]|uniref:Echinoid n=1 Tax=Culex quinquefasciatus TaxID=7176 RepID=B0WVD7_CULQU|nr:echinoid [Culex quinquefasciatus]|eukprot:XP_001861359.1 echinoid [Culex quinquefasciatus]